MKWILISFISLVFYSAAVNAEIMYVDDVIEITFRTGPSVQNKVLENLKSGQKVNVLEVDGTWSRVQLPDGREGWVVNRYLTSEIPKDIRLDQLTKKHEELQKKMNDLVENNKIILAENEKLKKDMENFQKAAEDANASYEQLKEESTQFLELKSKYEQAAEIYDKQKIKLEYIENQLNERIIQWALTGAGILTFGIILGLLFKRGKRRSYY